MYANINYRKVIVKIKTSVSTLFSVLRRGSPVDHMMTTGIVSAEAGARWGHLP